MGQWRAALVHYQQFLVEVPQAANREAVSDLIRLCASRLPPDRAVRGPLPTTPARPPPLIATPAQPPSLVDARAMAEPRHARGRAALLWTGGGIAGALLVSGTVTGILALRASDEHGRPGLSRERQGELKTRGEAYRTASTVSFAVAGSLAVSTALVYWLYRPRAPQRIAVSLLPGGAAVAVGQRF
jgi:hypothetical protein